MSLLPWPVCAGHAVEGLPLPHPAGALASPQHHLHLHINISLREVVQL